MTTLAYVRGAVLPTALALLPAKFTSDRALALLLAIGLQESRFLYRRQVGGPAHGFWQFEERGGCLGVLEHQATQPLLLPVCETLQVPATPTALYQAIVHQDVLAAVCARLLLWPDPRVLPAELEVDKAWDIYLACWRPGKPHRETWLGCYQVGWSLVL